MSGHLSSFALDALASGAAAPEAESHVAGCAACAARLAERKAALRTIAADARFESVRRRLPQAPSHKRRWMLGAGAFVAAAAAVALVLVHPGGGVRFKGSPSASLELLRDDTPAESFHPGERAGLRASAPGAAFVLVAALDADGLHPLVPPDGTQSAPFRSPETFGPFGVTAGDAVLLAIFSSAPVSFAELQQRVEAVRLRPDAGPDAILRALPSLPDETSRAAIQLRVRPN